MPGNNLYPKPKNEKLRLQALKGYDILDSISEAEYDSITEIAARICNTPVSLITLIDKDRQWFKSNHGTEITETPREIAFCNYTIVDKDNVLVVPDMRLDKRFANNPLVTKEPKAVFYAGAPLVTPQGYVLGSLCVLDIEKNNLTKDQISALKALAREIIGKLELRKKIKELKLTQQSLKKTNQKLKEFARIVSHDIKTPIANICMMANSFKKQYGNNLDETSTEYLNLINLSAKEVLLFIDQVFKKSEKTDQNKPGTKKADTYAVINKVISMVGPPDDIEIKLSGNFPEIQMDQTSLQQVFQNLISNAIKYNDKQKGLIQITSKSDKSNHYFHISDNGSGIDKQYLRKIFKEKQTLDKTDRYGNKGTGYGLATVKNILKESNGKISVTSELNIGTDFKISIPRIFN